MSRRGRSSQAFSLFAFQDIITSVTGIMILVTLILAVELIQRVQQSPSGRTQQIVADMQQTVEMVDQLESRIAELQDQLEQGASRIGEVAGFDPRGVEADVSNMEQINSEMSAEMDQLAAELANVLQDREDIEQQAEQHADDPQRIREMLEEIQRKKQELERLRSENIVIFNPTEGDAKTPWLVEITADKVIAAKAGENAAPTQWADVEQFAAWAHGRDNTAEYFVLLVKPGGVETFSKARAYLKQLRFDVGYDLLTADQTAIDPEKGAAAIE